MYSILEKAHAVGSENYFASRLFDRKAKYNQLIGLKEQQSVTPLLDQQASQRISWKMTNEVR